MPDYTPFVVACVRDQRRRGLAASTIDSRRRNYSLFRRWLNGKPLAQVTGDDIQLFLDGRRLGVRARYRWLSDLHILYQSAIRDGLTDTDPTVGIDRPRVGRLYPRPIRTDELAAAVELAPKAIRAMLLLAAYTGLRCVEISLLTREDIHDEMDPPVVLPRGKGGRPRIVPLHPTVWEALTGLPMPRTGRVFKDVRGDPLPPWKVSHIGNCYLHDLGIDSTMHKLRHWFATGVYRTSGHDLLLVRDLLGHANTATTEGYAAFDRSGADEAVAMLAVR